MESTTPSIKSRIHPNVSYKEKRKVETQDYNKELTAYEIEALDTEFVIGLGNPIRDQEKYGVVFHPIYFVPSNKSSEKIQIGVYEYDKKRAVEYMDVDGDLDINLLVPLFYSFAESVVNEIPSKTDDFLTKTPTGSPEEGNRGMDETKGETEPDEEDQEEGVDETSSISSTEEDVFKLTKRAPKSARDTSSPEQKEGPFQIKRDQEIPAPLPKETKEDATKIRENYEPGEHKKWIQQFMKNPHYDIIQVEANGDCFFATIREAFKQIGYVTTVADLRAVLAKEVTEDIYQENRRLFMDFKKTALEYEDDMERLKKRNQELKAQFKVSNKEERERIRTEIDEIHTQYRDLQEWKREADAMISSTMGDLTTIDSFEKYREYLTTPSYWADSWAISTLERVLNIKMIIFAEQYYKEEAMHSVLQCGEVNKIIQKSGKFEPKYYIMTAYTGDHYNLISYKEKRILTFPEIPYDVKTMIVNKCVELNSGTFYMIEDFRNFKVEMGLQADTGVPGDESDDEIEIDQEEVAAPTPGSKPRSSSISKHDLYESGVVFRFYNKSENTPMPGKGTGEEIPKDRLVEFKELKAIKDWRRKLDDQWMDIEHPFEIDGSKYASVEHYIQSSKFRYKGANQVTQQFAKVFSLNHGDDKIAKDITMAKAAGTTGKIKDVESKKTQQIRPKEATPDPDFVESGRDKRERAKALRAKFGGEGNQEMKILLKLTKRAKLVQYIPKQPPTIDGALMEVRRNL
jgi:hypothetical protein